MNILNEVVKGASRQFGREFGLAGANAILKGKNYYTVQGNSDFLKYKRNEFIELLEQFNTDIKSFVKTNLELATKKRKIKKTAILLSFPFLPVGMFGLHKFYLGQIGYGVLYIFLNFLWISPILALINFIQLIVISQEKFDVKYNPVFSYYSQFNFDE